MPEINSKKRLLFIITQSEMGGAQRFLFNLLGKIAGRFEIMVATGTDGDKELSQKIKTLGIEALELKHLKRDTSPHHDIRACFEIRDLIKNFKPDSLFLLSSKAGFIGSLVTALLRYSTKKPRVIYRIGGWSFNDPGPSWKKKLWLNLEKISAGWKDIIIVNNLHDFEQAQKLGIKPKKDIVLIHNGLDLNKIEFAPQDEARIRLYEKIARNSGKIFQAKIIVGTVSNLYPAKGIDVLIETAEYFINNESIAFVVIGEGDQRPVLEKMIKDKGLEKKIYLVGRIADARKLMGAFDLFVLPSLKEGFPWALIEAMATKLPVIATRVGANPEIIENGKNGFLVEPGNPRQLAAKIKEVLNSDHLYKEFSIQAHQTILFKFSEDKMIREIEALL